MTMPRESHLKFTITDFYRPLDTVGDHSNYGNHFSSPFHTYFPNLQYLLSSLSAEPPALCIPGKIEAVLRHVLQGPTALSTHLSWMSLLGSRTRLFLPLLHRMLGSLAYPNMASAPLPCLSSIFPFLCLPDQSCHQSRLPENRNHVLSHTVAARVLTMTTKLTEMWLWYLRISAPPLLLLSHCSSHNGLFTIP